MTITAGTHLLGSKAGYTTLAQSPDITQVEQQELSVLGFGQTSDVGFLESLAVQPSAYGRLLSSGRFAITRCFKGTADDAGRPTLRLCSIVLAAKDYVALAKAGLEPVLIDDAIWSEASFLAGNQVKIHSPTIPAPRSVHNFDLIAMDAWASVTAEPGSLASLPDDARTTSAILALPQVMADEDRLQYRWGVRLLGSGVPSDVCTMAVSASRSGRRKVISLRNGQSFRHPAVMHLSTCLGNGLRQLPPMRAMIAEAVPIDSQLGVDDRLLLESRRRRARSIRRVAAVGGAVVFLAILATLIIKMAHRGGQVAPQPTMAAETHADEISAPEPVHQQVIEQVPAPGAIDVTTSAELQRQPPNASDVEPSGRDREVKRTEPAHPDRTSPKPEQPLPEPTQNPAVQPPSPIEPLPSSDEAGSQRVLPAPTPPTHEELIQRAKNTVGRGLPIPTDNVIRYLEDTLGPFMDAMKLIRDELVSLEQPIEKTQQERNDIDALQSVIRDGFATLGKRVENLVQLSTTLLSSENLPRLRLPTTDNRTLEELRVQRDGASHYLRLCSVCAAALDEVLKNVSAATFSNLKGGRKEAEDTNKQVKVEIDNLEKSLAIVIPRIKRLETEGAAQDAKPNR